MLVTAIRNIITSVSCLFVSWLVCRRGYSVPHNFWCRWGKKGTNPINFIHFSGNKAKKTGIFSWLAMIEYNFMQILDDPGEFKLRLSSHGWCQI